MLPSGLWYAVALILIPSAHGSPFDEGELVVPYPDLVKRDVTTTSDPFTTIGIKSTVFPSAGASKATASLLGANDFKYPSTSDPSYLSNYTVQDPSALDGVDQGLFTTLTDTTGAVQLVTLNDGNLYLAAAQTSSPPQAGASFHKSQNIIFGDMQGRLFHYYPGEVAAYGISRIRVSSLANKTPLGSQMITLAPTMSGSKMVYVAVDTSGNLFYLTWCNIGGQLSKVFLAKDLDAGLAKLQSTDVRWTVTGGVVSKCAPLALAAASS